MEKFNPRISRIIEEGNLVALRSRRDHRILNVSYTIDGLRWTTDEATKQSDYSYTPASNEVVSSRLLYYKDAYLVHWSDEEGKWHPTIKGDTSPSDDVYIQSPYIPKNHYRYTPNGRRTNRFNGKYQKEEYIFSNKGLKMLYSSNIDEETDEVQRKDRVVWSTV